MAVITPNLKLNCIPGVGLQEGCDNPQRDGVLEVGKVYPGPRCAAQCAAGPKAGGRTLNCPRKHYCCT